MNLRHQIINQVVRILRDIKSVTIWKINILTQIADGHRCEQWPFNLPFHRTGLTAQPEQRSNLTWEDEASTKIGFPRFDLGAPFRNNIWTFNRGQGRAHAWEDSGNPFDRDRLVNLGAGQANIRLQIDLVVPMCQPSDDKSKKLCCFLVPNCHRVWLFQKCRSKTQNPQTSWFVLSLMIPQQCLST